MSTQDQHSKAVQQTGKLLMALAHGENRFQGVPLGAGRDLRSLADRLLHHYPTLYPEPPREPEALVNHSCEGWDRFWKIGAKHLLVFDPYLGHPMARMAWSHCPWCGEPLSKETVP